MPKTISELEIEQLKKRGLTTRKPISNSVDIELWKLFNKLSERTGINKSRLLDQAMILLLNHYEDYTQVEKSPVIKLKEAIKE